jgi:S-adenosylmethionine synthetase
MAAPRNGRIVTCESMTSGHPDKLCDQISGKVPSEVLCQKEIFSVFGHYHVLPSRT